MELYISFFLSLEIKIGLGLIPVNGLIGVFFVFFKCVVTWIYMLKVLVILVYFAFSYL